MAEINVDIVMTSISRALKAAHPASKAHATSVPQDFDAPAFFIRNIAGPKSSLAGYVHVGEQQIARSARHRRSPVYEITYFPGSELEHEQAAECRLVQELLYEVLEMIETPGGDLLSGRNIEGKVIDNVLVMTVAYPYNVVRTERAPPMEELRFTVPGLPTITYEEENHE